METKKIAEGSKSAKTDCYARFTTWIGDDDCLQHHTNWQYWRRGKRYCLGCLRDEVESRNSYFKSDSHFSATERALRNDIGSLNDALAEEHNKRKKLENAVSCFCREEVNHIDFENDNQAIEYMLSFLDA